LIADELTDQEKRIIFEVDLMAFKSIFLWIQSRQQFVGEVDFGDVSMNEDYKHLNNKECEEEIDGNDEEPEETGSRRS
jgi:hypothetical protein